MVDQSRAVPNLTSAVEEEDMEQDVGGARNGIKRGEIWQRIGDIFFLSMDGRFDKGNENLQAWGARYGTRNIFEAGMKVW